MSSCSSSLKNSLFMEPAKLPRPPYARHHSLRALETVQATVTSMLTRGRVHANVSGVVAKEALVLIGFNVGYFTIGCKGSKRTLHVLMTPNI